MIVKNGYIEFSAEKKIAEGEYYGATGSQTVKRVITGISRKFDTVTPLVGCYG